MAQPANTYDTYETVGIREDLSDIIHDISPEETPFLDSIKRRKATQTKYEWQVDELAAPTADNQNIEGDDATTDAVAPTTRLDNYTQIFDKVVRISGTNEAVDAAGRGSEMAYQVMKRTKEIKKDMEMSFLANKAKAVGSDALARVTAGAFAYVTTNSNLGATGTASAGNGSDAYVAGTARPFAEDDLKDVLGKVWDEGGYADTIYLGRFNRTALSGFTGNAQREINAADKKLVNTVKIYVSDWGDLKVVASRHIDADKALIVDHDMFAVATLRGLHTKELARTGDSERKQMIVEAGLEVCNEKAHGAVVDLTVS